MIPCKPSRPENGGFTLVEVAVVLLIIGILLGSILGPVAQQRENRNIQTTVSLLQEAHDSLLGFAALNGFLPCPATLGSNGLESRSGGANNNCTNEHGYLPSNTLGISGKFNANNLLTDAWGSPVRYSLSNVATWEYAKKITMQSVPATYSICNAANCSAGTVTASNIVAVIYSIGPDRNAAPASADQQDNLDGDDQFVSRIPTEGANTGFDDIVTWISPNTLALYLVKAGQFAN